MYPDSAGLPVGPGRLPVSDSQDWSCHARSVRSAAHHTHPPVAHRLLVTPGTGAVRPDQAWPHRTLLAALGPEDRGALFRLGSRRAFARGEPLITEGDGTREVFVILKGCAKTFGSSADGREVLLAILVRGDMAGEIAALDDEPRLSAVVAATPGEALVVSQPRFLAFHTSRPEAALAISRSLSAKLRLVTRHRLDVTGGPVVKRLARTLGYLVESCSTPCPQGYRIDVPLSQTELASLIGASLPALYRATGALRARGVLATHYREQIVMDRKLLEKISRESDDDFE